MELNQRDLEAAHQLGEAILRFVKAIVNSNQLRDLPNKRQVAPTKSEDRLLRISEAAEILSLSRSTIYELIYSGRLPSVTIGSARRLKWSEVMKLLNGVE